MPDEGAAVTTVEEIDQTDVGRESGIAVRIDRRPAPARMVKRGDSMGTTLDSPLAAARWISPRTFIAFIGDTA